MASILPNGKNQFIDQNGKPLVNGTVTFYLPSTTTKKDTYQDSALTQPNTNPVVLDSKGQATIWGNGSYRQVTQDALGVVIWDQVVSAAVSSDSLSSATGSSLIGTPDGSTLASALLLNLNRVVDSIAALRATNHLFYSRAFVTGYYVAHDGGGGAYQYDPTDASSADNGGTIIVANDGARWKLQHFGTVTNKQFGAKVDGVTDDTAATQKFVDVVTTIGLRGQFASGVSILTSMLTITIRSLGFSLEGCGGNSTNFSASSFSSATPVIKLVGSATYIGWRIGGFSISGSNGAASETIGFQIGDPSTVAINILGFQYSTIFDVQVSRVATLWQIAHARMIRFVDCSGWNSNYPSANTCLSILQNGAFTGDLVFDTCQFVTTTTTGNKCLSINSSVGPYNINNGFCSIAGIKFRSTLFYSGDKCIYMYATAQAWIGDIWFVDGCQTDQSTTNDFYAESNGASTRITDIHLEGMYFNRAASQAVSFSSTGSGGQIDAVWIEECEFLHPANLAISFFGPACNDLHVCDNVIEDCENNGAAIEFNGCTGVTANGNRLRLGPFSKAPYYLLTFDGGTTRITAIGNDSYGIARVGGINDLSTTTQKTITSNLGYNPLPPTSITVGASPFSYVNNSGAPQLIQLSGGAFSNVSINGWALPVTSSMLVPLPQGSTIGVTYSATPTMNSFGL